MKSNEQFVNLYMQTEYSLLSSTIRINNIGSVLKEYEYNACAITDIGMHGTIKFYQECKKNGIKPILGLKVQLYNMHFDNALLLYATNKEGYHNLLSIATMTSLNKTSTIADFLPFNYGIIAIIPSDESEIIKYYYNNAIDKAIVLLKEYQEIFKNIYLGIDLQSSQNVASAPLLISFANNNNIECVAINRSLYLHDNDIDAYETIKTLELGKTYELSEKEKNCCLLQALEGELLFQNYSELLANTVKIAACCQVELEFGKYRLPSYGMIDSKRYLRELCYVGLNKRLNQHKEKNLKCDFNYDLYTKRLLNELDVIEKMGFSDYFLIVYDYVRFAKNSDIFVSPGRGSAGASLVSYAIGITDVDPIEYGLLFERFLNCERISMPDIDVDFQDNRRDEVIKYIGQKYGNQRVAHITTFGTLKARLAIRDVARVLNISDIKLKTVLRHIPQRFEESLKLSELIKKPEFNKLIEQDEEISKLITIAIKIEGMPRNCSTHAAGIIMADNDLTYYTPLQPGINGLHQTQFDAGDLELLGLVKMDVLGIRNLTIINNVINSLNKTLKVRDIPLDDADTYKKIARGETFGVFQLESSGVRKLLYDLRCSCFMDIVNATSLYRPGPMEMIPLFVRRKLGEEYAILHPDLDEILKPTYGIIVYQEQIMLIVQCFAGYSLGQADVLRRAVSKKKHDVIEEERKRFVSNSTKLGYDENIAQQIYNYIEKFANYGFNKNHAVAYSLVAYWMAYLKTHFFPNFMVAVMTNSIGDVQALIKYINECRQNQIEVLPPNINISSRDFVFEKEKIFYPLLGIANIGEINVDHILVERQKGVFNDYENFVDRLGNVLNRRQIASLIHAGALDCFGYTRKGMLDNLDNINEQSLYRQALGDKIVQVKISEDEYSFSEISKLEKEALGFNLKYSIFIKYREFRLKENIPYIAELKNRMHTKIIYSVQAVRLIMTKTQSKMAFLEIADESGYIDAVIFPTTLQEMTENIEVGNLYISDCKIEVRDDKLQAILESIYNLK